MSYKEQNNEFFSYYGTISRKNYVINLLILMALFVGMYFVKFENFAPFVKPEFLYKVLIFMAEFFKFVILMSAISVVYRRISDFSINKPYKFMEIMKKIFAILFVFPILYLFCLRYFIDFLPFIQNILDLIVIFILIPLGLISIIIFGFIKGK